MGRHRLAVRPQDGSFHPADVILYCTGYEKSYDYFESQMRERLGLQKDGLYLYRNCLPCAVPHVAFVGSEVGRHGLSYRISLAAGTTAMAFSCYLLLYRLRGDVSAVKSVL